MPGARRRVREWAGRIGLIGLGLALALVGLELALQLGAVVVRFTHESRSAARDPGRFRVVCLGDSNTFGLYLEPHESYPAQLERELAARLPDRAVEVLNLGAPGLNSSRLLRQYPELLETLAPDLVIILVGVNDLWTDPKAESSARPTTLRDLVARHSRVVRLVRLLRARGAADVEVSIEDGAPFERADQWVRIGGRAFDFGFERAHVNMFMAEHQLAKNLLALRKATEASGARALFMTYPGRYELYRRANGAILEAARKGLPLLDLTQVFLEPCPLAKCPEMLFEDQHPTAEGYRLVAKQVAAWIEAQR